METVFQNPIKVYPSHAHEFSKMQKFTTQFGFRPIIELQLLEIGKEIF